MQKGKFRDDPNGHRCPYCDFTSLAPMRDHIIACRVRRKYKEFSTFELEYTKALLEANPKVAMDTAIRERMLKAISGEIKRRRL